MGKQNQICCNIREEKLYNFIFNKLKNLFNYRITFKLKTKLHHRTCKSAMVITTNQENHIFPENA